MSAFLGPIHYWLYKKIGILGELTGEIEKLAKDNGWQVNDLEKYEYTELPALEEVIDESNIHNWLQERIIEKERDYAELVAEILRGGADRLDDIKKTAYDFGRKRAFAAETDAIDSFREINNIIVDGMPCDRVNEIVRKTPEEIEWLKLEDLHSAYWEAAGADGEVYYTLNSELINGLLSETGLKYQNVEENRYKIG